MSLPTLEVLFAPSVVGADYGTRMVLDVSVLDTGTLGDGALFYDITAYARSIRTSRGRWRALDRFTTGTASIVLDNRDRRFDPTNTAGPYYNATVGVSGVVPGVPVVIRATWSSTAYTVFRGFIDSWSFAYPDNGVSDATVTINCSDAFKALSAVIGALPSATTVTSTTTSTYRIAASQVDGTSGVSVIGSSTTGNINVSNGTATTPIIGTAGDLSGARVATVLDAVSWPANLRSVDTGFTKLEVQNATQTVLGLLEEVAATEGGAVYVEDDGSVVFADRYRLITGSRSATSQATYDTTVAGGKAFTTVEPVYDDSTIYNVVRINRRTTSTTTGDTLIGTTVTAANAESQSLYGSRTLDLELPIPSTVDSDTSYGQSAAEGLALFLASIYANPELRPASLTFRPQSSESLLYPEVLGRRIFDRVTVKFTVPGGGSAIERDCFVERVDHTILPDLWETTFGLASATYYTGFFVLDSSSAGLLDTNKLAF